MRSGASLSEAMAAPPESFSRLETSMVEDVHYHDGLAWQADWAADRRGLPLSAPANCTASTKERERARG